MANRYGIVILVAVLALLLPSSECVTTLVCGSSVTTVNLNQVYATYTYPASGSYPTSTTCQWLFQASDSSARITFTVTNIYVHCGDVLKFHDGTSASASAIGSSVCCSAPCGASKAAQTTTGNSLFVLFNTDSTTNLLESGFRVSIVVGKDESNCPTNGVNNTETLTAQTALTSPQFPARYPTSHVCTYTYTYTGGTVRLEFVYLDVELDSGTCFDYVEMYNGSSTSSPLIAKVCGSTLPTVTYTSTESSLTVKFSSDNQETKTGFYANIIPVAAETTTSAVVTTETSTAAQASTPDGGSTETSTLETTTNEPTSQSTTTEETSTSGSTSLSTTETETSTGRTTSLLTTDGETSTSGSISPSTTDGETSISGSTSLSTTDGEASTRGTRSLSSTNRETSTNGTTSLSTTDRETSTSGTTSLSTSNKETTTNGPGLQSTARETTTNESTSHISTAEESTNGPTTQSTTSNESTNEPTTQSTTSKAQTKHPKSTKRIVKMKFFRKRGGVQLTDSSKTGDNSGVIAAIVLSVIAIAALAVVVGFLFLKKRIKGGYSIGVDKKDADMDKDGGESKQDRDTNDDNPNKSEMENKPPRSTAIN